jgi:hypothetical protein
LIVRIPKAFKDCLKENLLDLHFDAHDTTDTFVKKKIVSNKKAKFIYRSLIDNIVQNPTDKFLKWEELLVRIFCNYEKMMQRHLFENLSV